MWCKVTQFTHKFGERRATVLSFFGEYAQVIDAKNRVFIPSKFRDVLGEKIYITRNVDGCLTVYSEEMWTALTEKIMAIPSSKGGSKIARFVFSKSADAKCDSQGRVVLPQPLVEFAALKKDIYVIGVGDHIEIWDKAARDSDQSEENIADILDIMREYDI